MGTVTNFLWPWLGKKFSRYSQESISYHFPWLLGPWPGKKLRRYSQESRTLPPPKVWNFPHFFFGRVPLHEKWKSVLRILCKVSYTRYWTILHNDKQDNIMGNALEFWMCNYQIYKTVHFPVNSLILVFFFEDLACSWGGDGHRNTLQLRHEEGGLFKNTYKHFTDHSLHNLLWKNVFSKVYIRRGCYQQPWGENPQYLSSK